MMDKENVHPFVLSHSLAFPGEDGRWSQNTFPSCPISPQILSGRSFTDRRTTKTMGKTVHLAAVFGRDDRGWRWWLLAPRWLISRWRESTGSAAARNLLSAIPIQISLNFPHKFNPHLFFPGYAFFLY